MEPDAKVQFPTEWDINKDLPIQVKASGIHSNFEIQQIRVTFDNASLNAKNPLYPIILHQSPRKLNDTIWKVNRITKPTSKKLKTNLPLVDLSKEGKIKTGTITGQIQVDIEYIKGIGKGYSLAGELRTYSKKITVPYSIKLK